ncbi:MAG: molybdopterin molybdenumtransferase MoeA [Rhizobiales bacterium]|nr:molybdopterin molybdenumtransferase MoeA [Hyphomicrobiales bacterium]
MTLLAVEEAKARVLEGVHPLDAVNLEIEAAAGMTLADGVESRLDQPPADVSSMDGYAVRAADCSEAPREVVVVGEAAAGHPLAASLASGQAARIFTGGVLPVGADAVIAQEDCTPLPTAAGAPMRVRLDAVAKPGQFVRRRGMDFSRTERLLESGTRLDARALSLAAAMGHGKLAVRRPPRVAILATGDELVAPGVPPQQGQIPSSIPVGLVAMVAAAGGEPMLLGIARDTRESLADALAKSAGADILVTIGGASVGDHDLVGPTLAEAGLDLHFWRIAMRPGKPLMFGRLGARRVLGLPGNPVSALICARVFLLPLIHRLLGRRGEDFPLLTGVAAGEVEANGPRTHYMRATIEGRTPQGAAILAPYPSQDSSLLADLLRASALVVRQPHAPATPRGGALAYHLIDF